MRTCGTASELASTVSPLEASETNGKVVLSARGLSKFYGPFRAVDSVDLDIHDATSTFHRTERRGQIDRPEPARRTNFAISRRGLLRRQAARHDHPELARASRHRSFVSAHVDRARLHCLQNVVAVQARRGLFRSCAWIAEPMT